ncbi:hypothetical protein GCM10022263_13360 [Nocardioides daeguensis]|uniref:NYN domain-containing protein n=2 Tax=Nocardioides daeguensis TaxID=908359 RepID=A0ABP6V381_9ACTN
MGMTRTDAGDLQLRMLHRPTGHRRGICLLPEVPPDVAAAAAQVLAEHGEERERRLATIAPRPGAEHTTDDEIVYFLDRFGHEYTVVLCGADRADTTGLKAAAERAGCALVLV